MCSYDGETSYPEYVNPAVRWATNGSTTVAESEVRWQASGIRPAGIRPSECGSRL